MFFENAQYTAPNAAPASPEAGCTKISLNSLLDSIFPFKEQFSPTPPAIHNLSYLYLFLSWVNDLIVISSTLFCRAAAMSLCLFKILAPYSRFFPNVSYFFPNLEL